MPKNVTCYKRGILSR